MRFLSSGIVFISSVTTGLADDGGCLTGAITTYFPAAKTSWLEELTLTAYDIAKTPSAVVPTTGADLIAAINTAYTATHPLNGALALRNTEVTTSLAASACASCAVQYVKDVISLYNNKGLPSECQVLNGPTTSVCLFALSSAIVKFNTCTTATSKDLGSATTVLSATIKKCTPQQIMQLDGKYNLYRSLLNAGLYGTQDADFNAAYQALPCRGVFDNWIAGFTAAATTGMKAACGATASHADQYTGTCTGSGTFGAPPQNLAAYLNTLISQLGGGFTINTGVNNRCTADQMSVFSSLNSFDAMVACSKANPANVAWRACMSTYWPTLGNMLDPATAVPCAACFNTAGGDINTKYNSAPSKLGGCATSSAVDCVSQVSSYGILDILYQCSGVSMSSSQTTCSTGDLEKISPSIGSSIIPMIIAARTVALDTSLTTQTSKLAAVVSVLSNMDGFSTVNSTMACSNCFKALAIDITRKMSTDANFLNSCSDEYSVGCLGYDYVASAILDFKDCSGITLDIETAYKCDDTQYDFLVNNDIPRYLFNQAVGTANATVASVMLKLVSDISAIEAENNIDLPCANCLSDLVSGLFDLPATTKAVCLASPAGCITLGAVSPIINKFITCSGHAFDVNAISAESDDSDSTDNSTTTNTTSNSVASMGTMAAVGAAILSVLMM